MLLSIVHVCVFDVQGCPLAPLVGVADDKGAEFHPVKVNINGAVLLALSLCECIFVVVC